MPIQGREVTIEDIRLIQQLIAANGQVKDMACRTLLLKLEQRGI